MCYTFSLATISSALPLRTANCLTSADRESNVICSTTEVCICPKGFVTTNRTKPCAYKQKEKLIAFLLTFVAGRVGADWFYLAAGNGYYIAAGIFKLLTGGGWGIWTMIDLIRVLTDSFPDGQGIALRDWS